MRIRYHILGIGLVLLALVIIGIEDARPLAYAFLLGGMTSEIIDVLSNHLAARDWD